MARNRNDNRYSGRKKKSPMRVIAGWILFIGVFLVLIFAIGDTVAVNHIAYALFRPKRGDIVQFSVSEDSHAAAAQAGTVYIRRVIALPGETIQIMDGTVYINGYPLKEEYASAATAYGGIVASQLTLNNDEYFVMADNRSNNFDSRDSTVGPILRDDILGKVWLRVLPLDKFGRLK